MLSLTIVLLLLIECNAFGCLRTMTSRRLPPTLCTFWACASPSRETGGQDCDDEAGCDGLDQRIARMDRVKPRRIAFVYDRARKGRPPGNHPIRRNV